MAKRIVAIYRVLNLQKLFVTATLFLIALPLTAWSWSANLTATPDPNKGDFTLSWTTNGSSGQYRVQERDAGTYTWSTIVILGGSTTTYAVADRTDGQYEYRIWHNYQDCSGGGRGGCTQVDDYSETITVTVDTNIPITQYISLDGTYDVSWDAKTGITEYQLEEQLGTGSWSNVYTGSNTSANLTGKTTGEYHYRLIECYATPCDDPSGTSTMHVEIVTLNATPTPIVSADTDGATPFSTSVDRKGNASIMIPLRSPNGVNGLAPRLALSYSSGAATILTELNKSEGVLGYGWSLVGLPEIRRCRIGIGGEIQHDDTDLLCLNGNALVKVGGAGSGYWDDDAEYRTEIDILAKVVAHGTGKPNREFEVFYPNGDVLVFGSTVETRLIAPEKTDPYLWSPRTHTDAFNNVVTYDWEDISAAGTNYLETINYANARIELYYDDRCDDLTDCDSTAVQNGENVAGIKARAVVLNEIETYVNNAVVDNYRLESNYVGGLLRLEEIQHCASSNGTSFACMESLNFAWDTLTIDDTAFGPSDQIVVDAVTNSFGEATNFDYVVIDGSGGTDHALHVDQHAEFIDSTSMIPSAAFSTRQRALVQYLKRPDGNAGQSTTEFKYQGYPLYNTNGYGYVGFPSVYSELYDNKMYVGSSETHYDGHIRQYVQHRLGFPFFGYTARQITDVNTDSSGGESWTRTSKKMWHYDQKLHFSTTVSYPYLANEYSESRELTAASTIGYANASKSTHTVCFKDLVAETCPTSGTDNDYPTQLTSKLEVGLYLNGNGVAAVWGDVGALPAVTFLAKTTEQTVDYNNIPSSWLYGFVNRAEFGWGTGSTITESITTDISRDSSTHNKPGAFQYFDGDPVYETTTTYTYDNYGNITNTSLTGVNLPPNVTYIDSAASSFTDNMYATSVTNAKSQSSTIGFDVKLGVVTTVTDPNSDVTTTNRDAFGRVISQVAPDGTTVSIVYGNCSSACTAVTWASPKQKITRTFKNGGTTVSPTEVAYFDGNGKLLLTEVDAFSGSDGEVRVQRHYDAVGKLLKQSLPYFSAGSGSPDFVEYFYDHKGRVVHVSKPDGYYVSTSIYADSGTGGYVNVEVVADYNTSGDSITKKSRFNVLGQLVDTTDALGTGDAVTTDYTYSVRGALATVDVDGVEVAAITYDTSPGNRKTIVESNSGTTTFDYYSVGWLKKTTDANNTEIKFDYDALGRVTKRFDGFGAAGTVTNTWTWDTAANGVGLLASRNNGSEFSETYTYNADAKLLSITADVDVSGFNDNGSYVISYAYDSEKRLDSITYPNSISFDSVFTADGYLSQVMKGATILHEYTDIDAFGNIVAEKYRGGQLLTARSYDAKTGRLTSIATGTTSTPKSVQDLLYTWRTDGLLLTRKDENGTSVTSDDMTEEFVHDDLRRLKSAITNSSLRKLTQTYDEHGNLLTKESDVTGDLVVDSFSYPTSSKPHRLVSATINSISNTFEYDAIGNIDKYDAATGDDTFIEYDKGSRVDRITVGDSIGDTTPTARDEFWYGPDGQRYLRKASWYDGTTVKTSWILYLLGGTFEEVHPEHDSTVNYSQRVLVTANVQHQYINSPGSTTTRIDYLHRDHLGNIVARTDESGTSTSIIDFDPFGRQRSTSWDRDATASEIEDLADDEDSFTGRGFTDHEMLNRTGFVHMNGRVFDSRIGRFIQPDPIVSRPNSSQSYNRYSYVANSPLSFTDPSGFTPTSRAPCGSSVACEDPSISFGIYIGIGWPGNSSTPPKKGRQLGYFGPNYPSVPVVLTPPTLLDRLFTIFECWSLRNVGGACLAGPGGLIGLPGSGGGGGVGGGLGLPGGEWDGLILNYLPDELGYDQDDPNYHRYQIGATFICSINNNSNCTLDNVGKIVNHFSVPAPAIFTFASPEQGRMMLLLRNPIIHNIDSTNYKYRNVTLEGHDFDPGEVLHYLTQANGEIFLTTIGVGVGAHKLFNQAAGLVFLRTHSNTFTLFQRMYGKGRPWGVRP